MSGDIFLLQDDGELVELNEAAYETEALLQRFLAQYPDLLAGKQMNPEAPRKWLLISREMAVPLGENDSVWASVDHLFLDQDAVPTLVEVKRSSDTRIRREVIGQMIDYAANAVVYWPIEKIIARFEATCQERNIDPADQLIQLLGSDHDAEKFWQSVKTNLQAGRVRMVFVADEIPVPLRRAVEFLNEQMDPAEVLAVEIKQYVGRGLKTPVPRVIGQTSEAQKRKTVQRTSNKWDEPAFFEDLARRQGLGEVVAAKKILTWARDRGLRIWWGEGARTGSFVPVFDHNGQGYQLFAVATYGRMEVYFQWYQYKPPFDAEAKRRELLDKLNAIKGINFPPDAITRRPSFPLKLFENEQQGNQILAVFDWFIEEVRRG
ncbi:MAG: hypothetical protein H6632_02440 [Anaerolineales bacterium]|nr:hypothetical protein [Anaerolineales bacterium]